MVKLKGATIVEGLRYLEEKYSKEILDRVKAKLSDKDQELLFGKKIVSVSWVPMNAWTNFCIALDNQVGEGDLQLVKAMSEEMSDRNFKGIYKIFMSILSPQSIISKFPTIWKSQFDQGQCQLVKHNETCYDVIVSDWEPPLNHELLQIPYQRKALSIAGGKNIRITHPKCIARGDDKCVFHYEFD